MEIGRTSAYAPYPLSGPFPRARAHLGLLPDAAACGPGEFAFLPFHGSEDRFSTPPPPRGGGV